MRVIEPDDQSKSVRADSVEAKSGFKSYDEYAEEWDYFVPMKDNPNTLYIRRKLQDNQSIFITPNYVLVFNVMYNCAGIVKADKMVEPVNLTVNVEVV